MVIFQFAVLKFQSVKITYVFWVKQLDRDQEHFQFFSGGVFFLLERFEPHQPNFSFKVDGYPQFAMFHWKKKFEVICRPVLEQIWHFGESNTVIQLQRYHFWWSIMTMQNAPIDPRISIGVMDDFESLFFLRHFFYYFIRVINLYIDGHLFRHGVTVCDQFQYRGFNLII